MNIHDAIWLRGNATLSLKLIANTYAELQKRGVTHAIFTDDTFATAVKSRSHMILDGLTPREMSWVRPVMERRGNFSVLAIDWWLTPEWALRYADWEFYRNYSGIAVRHQGIEFVNRWSPPLLSIPDRWSNAYERQCALLRPLAVAAAPARSLWRYLRPRAPRRSLMAYFPMAVDPKDFPDAPMEKKWDVANLGAVFGAWMCRNRSVGPMADFANLYDDRRRIANVLRRYDRVYDWRREGRKDWYGMAEVIRQSRLALVTGGLHRNSVGKFIETVCLGTPILGSALPHEFPWLVNCTWEVNPNQSPEEIVDCVADGLECSESLARNCRAWKPTLMSMYSAGTLLDMLQEQVDNKPVRPGYLK